MQILLNNTVWTYPFFSRLIYCSLADAVYMDPSTTHTAHSAPFPNLMSFSNVPKHSQHSYPSLPSWSGKALRTCLLCVYWFQITYRTITSNWCWYCIWWIISGLPLTLALCSLWHFLAISSVFFLDASFLSLSFLLSSILLFCFFFFFSSFSCSIRSIALCTG